MVIELLELTLSLLLLDLPQNISLGLQTCLPLLDCLLLVLSSLDDLFICKTLGLKNLLLSLTVLLDDFLIGETLGSHDFHHGSAIGLLNAVEALVKHGIHLGEVGLPAATNRWEI